MVDRTNLANQIAKEHCLTYRGEKICDENFKQLVSELAASGLPQDQLELAVQNGEQEANAILYKT